MRRVSVRVPVTLADSLARIAAADGVTVAAVARRAVAEYVAARLADDGPPR